MERPGLEDSLRIDLSLPKCLVGTFRRRNEPCEAGPLQRPTSHGRGGRDLPAALTQLDFLAKEGRDVEILAADDGWLAFFETSAGHRVQVKSFCSGLGGFFGGLRPWRRRRGWCRRARWRWTGRCRLRRVPARALVPRRRVFAAGVRGWRVAAGRERGRALRRRRRGSRPRARSSWSRARCRGAGDRRCGGRRLP